MRCLDLRLFLVSFTLGQQADANVALELYSGPNAEEVVRARVGQPVYVIRISDLPAKLIRSSPSSCRRGRAGLWSVVWS